MKKKIFTLEDMAHYILYRELDKMGIKDAYKKATMLCDELSKSVQYRRNLKR